MDDFSPKIFKAYDVRGIYPDDFNEEAAYQIGKAFIKFLSQKRELSTRKIILGRDSRLSSPDILEVLIQSVSSAGVDVINLELCSTPHFYWTVINEQADGGIYVTASHNPKEYNGLKICRSQARMVGLDEGLGEMKKMIEKGQMDEIAAMPGAIKTLDNLQKYVDSIREFFKKMPLKPLKIVADCANGAIGPEARAFFAKTPFEVEYLNERPDGNFPGHEANPLKEENLEPLRRIVVSSGADMGVSFDGDGDRVGFLDEKGQTVRADFMTALIAREILKHKPGRKIYYDLRESRIVPQIIKEAGGEPVIGPVGNTLIKKMLFDQKMAFGGELSCHYYFEETGYAESSLLAMLNLAAIISESGKPLSETIEPLKKYFHTGEVNFRVGDPDKKLVEAQKRFSDGQIKKIDGITVEYPNWWFNLRKSNTEPLVRLNLEADTKELLAEKKELLEKFITS